MMDCIKLSGAIRMVKYSLAAAVAGAAGCTDVAVPGPTYSDHYELQVIRTIEGVDLPLPIPVAPGATFTHGYYQQHTVAQDEELLEDFLLFFETEYPIGAAWFYDGCFWSRVGSRRSPGVTMDGTDPNRIVDFEVVAGGGLSVARYDLSDRGVYVLVQVGPKPRESEEQVPAKKYRIAVAVAVLRNGA